MKTYQEAKEARRKLAEIMRMDLSSDHRWLINGMRVALQWVCEERGRTLERLLSNPEEIVPGFKRDLKDYKPR